MLRVPSQNQTIPSAEADAVTRRPERSSRSHGDVPSQTESRAGSAGGVSAREPAFHARTPGITDRISDWTAEPSPVRYWKTNCPSAAWPRNAKGAPLVASPRTITPPIGPPSRPDSLSSLAVIAPACSVGWCRKYQFSFPLGEPEASARNSMAWPATVCCPRSTVPPRLDPTQLAGSWADACPVAKTEIADYKAAGISRETPARIIIDALIKRISKAGTETSCSCGNEQPDLEKSAGQWRRRMRLFQNCRSEREFALTFRRLEPTHSGCYEVLKAARMFLKNCPPLVRATFRWPQKRGGCPGKFYGPFRLGSQAGEGTCTSKLWQITVGNVQFGFHFAPLTGLNSKSPFSCDHTTNSQKQANSGPSDGLEIEAVTSVYTVAILKINSLFVTTL